MSSTEKNRTTIIPSRSILFISDVHLGAYSKEKNTELEEDIIRLVTFCQDYGLEIVILGDFFEYWMEYPGGRVPPLGQKMLRHFELFHTQSGSHTLYVTGNHDYWTDGYLKNLGFDVEHEYRIIKDSDIVMMVLHGDGLRDPAMQLPRPMLHRFLRNPYFITLYKTFLPPRLGWSGMRLFSSGCRKTALKRTNMSTTNELDSWARNLVLTNNEIQAVVYGHHHQPLLWQESRLTCMNCGSFGSDKTVGLYTDKKFQIVTWDSHSCSLLTGNTNVTARNDTFAN